MPRSRPTSRVDAIAQHVRPLPARPNLDYERKAAKLLLKQLNAGDAEALGRLQAAHPAAHRELQHRECKLSDAQHVIAREYGFASWPRLKEYFEELERHCHAPRHNGSDGSVEHFERRVESVLRLHKAADVVVAQELAHFVPRFHAHASAAILATPITIADARLVVAREHRRASWEELTAGAEASRELKERSRWDGKDTPEHRARRAIIDGNVATLAALLDEFPDLVVPTTVQREWRGGLAGAALSRERKAGGPNTRSITDLIASRGGDVQRELNERLLGFPQDTRSQPGGMPPEAVQWYLDRGADAQWMPHNGITVLEHALVRYRNQAAVRLIAERVVPRRALWIAAGLGDVEGVRRYLGTRGSLSADGRAHRPDLMAMGCTGWLPPNLEADDLGIMHEAFQIAAWNEQWATMDVLLQAGLPVDHAPSGWSVLMEAVGNLHVPLAAYLVSRGADLDREWPRHGSARQSARSRVRHDAQPVSQAAREMLSICGAETVEALLAEVDAQRQNPPVPDERARLALRLAADDAVGMGQSTVSTENMLVGILRLRKGVYAEMVSGCGIDMAKLHSMIGQRLRPDGALSPESLVPLDRMAEAALLGATRAAEDRRRESVGPVHLLVGIVAQDAGPGAQLLRNAGADLEQLIDRLKQGC